MSPDVLKRMSGGLLLKARYNANFMIGNEWQLTVTCLLKFSPRKIHFNFGHLPTLTVNWKLSQVPSDKVQSALFEM